MWEYIKLGLIGALLLGVVATTWEIQNWRWEAKQELALAALMKHDQAVAKQMATAAASFEQERDTTDAKYASLQDAVNSQPSSVLCFDGMQLLLVNSALSRTATYTPKHPVKLPGPKALN